MSKKALMETIREYKEHNDDYIKALRESHDATDIMHYTWMIARNVEWIRNEIWNCYIRFDLSSNQHNLLNAYLVTYKNHIWDVLYDLASEF